MVALGVTSVLAVLALHAGALQEELAAQCAQNDRVELLLDELVAVLLMNGVLALANGALTTETSRIVGAFPDVRLDCVPRESLAQSRGVNANAFRTEVDVKLDGALRLDGEPGVDALALHARSSDAKCPGETLLAVEPADRDVVHLRATPASAAPLRHPRSRDPAWSSLGAHLLPPQLLDDVAQAQPKHADRDGRALARHFVVDGDLGLVRLVDVDLEVFVPAVVARAVRACSRRVFNLDVDDGLGGMLRPLRLRSVGQVAGRLDRDLESAGKRSSKVGLGVLSDTCVLIGSVSVKTEAEEKAHHRLPPPALP